MLRTGLIAACGSFLFFGVTSVIVSVFLCESPDQGICADGLGTMMLINTTAFTVMALVLYKPTDMIHRDEIGVKVSSRNDAICYITKFYYSSKEPEDLYSGSQSMCDSVFTELVDKEDSGDYYCVSRTIDTAHFIKVKGKHSEGFVLLVGSKL